MRFVYIVIYDLSNAKVSITKTSHVKNDIKFGPTLMQHVLNDIYDLVSNVKTNYLTSSFRSRELLK